MKINVKRMCTAAVAIAVIFIGTYIVQIPIPGGSGYVNLGDTFVFLFACILPAPYAIAAAAAGPALADIAGGFVLYAPFTLLIKGLMAACFSRRAPVFSARNVGALVGAAAILVGGYYLSETILLSSFAAPAANIPYNAAQAGVNALLFLLVSLLLTSVRAFETFRREL